MHLILNKSLQSQCGPLEVNIFKVPPKLDVSDLIDSFVDLFMFLFKGIRLSTLKSLTFEVGCNFIMLSAKLLNPPS